MAWAHKHVSFQPTIGANRKRLRTTLNPNGPTIGADSPQTTARTHNPCKRTTRETWVRRIYCPIFVSFRDSSIEKQLSSQDMLASRHGRPPILFGTVPCTRLLPAYVLPCVYSRHSQVSVTRRHGRAPARVGRT